MILKPNHWQIIDLSFEAQLRNSRSSSPRARCILHTASPDLLIVRPPSTRHVRPSPVLYTTSPTPATILIAACHTAPATYTSRDKQTRFSIWYKDKSKTTEMSCIRIQTSPSQLLITLKSRNWWLGFWHLLPQLEVSMQVVKEVGVVHPLSVRQCAHQLPFFLGPLLPSVGRPRCHE
jgi:hypothetical protein